jgi:hypothetical protein
MIVILREFVRVRFENDSILQVVRDAAEFAPFFVSAGARSGSFGLVADSPGSRRS